jgi:hypothetical protein
MHSQRFATDTSLSLHAIIDGKPVPVDDEPSVKQFFFWHTIAILQLDRYDKVTHQQLHLRVYRIAKMQAQAQAKRRIIRQRVC